MVTAPPPQEKVTCPPAVTAERNDASVQLAAVPVPTTLFVVGTAHAAGTSQLAKAVPTVPESVVTLTED